MAKRGRKSKGGHINKYGYRVICIEGKPKLEHVAVAERALGKTLPKGAQVHHVNGNPLDNRPENLVICPNANYHRILHRRGVSMEILNRADGQQCARCQNWIVPRVSPPPSALCMVRGFGRMAKYRLSRHCQLIFD